MCPPVESPKLDSATKGRADKIGRETGRSTAVGFSQRMAKTPVCPDVRLSLKGGVGQQSPWARINH